MPIGVECFYNFVSGIFITCFPFIDRYCTRFFSYLKDNSVVKRVTTSTFQENSPGSSSRFSIAWSGLFVPPSIFCHLRYCQRINFLIFVFSTWLIVLKVTFLFFFSLGYRWMMCTVSAGKFKGWTLACSHMPCFSTLLCLQQHGKENVNIFTWIRKGQKIPCSNNYISNASSQNSMNQSISTPTIWHIITVFWWQDISGCQTTL